MTVTAPAEAEEGSVVHFTIEYDESEVVLDSVQVGSVHCGVNGLGEYYFVMPEEDCTIEVRARTVEGVTYQSIENASDYAVELVGVGTQAAVGSIVRFSLIVKPGFNVQGMEITSEGFGHPAVDFTTSVEDGKTYYEFIMPESAVEIRTLTTRSSFEILYDSSLITGIYQTRSGTSQEESCREGIAEFGAEVRVVMRSTDYETVTGLLIQETGEVVEAVAGTYTVEATFTMPARLIHLVPVTTPLYRPLSLVSSEHLTVSVYQKDEEGSYVPVEEAVADTEVFVRVDGVDETWGIRSLKVTFREEDAYYDESIDLLETGTNEDGYYSFTMPVAEGNTTITVVESNMTKFAGYPFVGTYRGNNLYNGKAETGVPVGNSSYNFTITPDGTMSGGKNFIIDSATNAEGPGTALMASPEGEEADSIFAYGDKIIFSHYNFTSLTSNDNIFAVKKQDPADADSLYTMDYEIFGNNSYIAVQYYRDDALYASAFVDYNGTILGEDHYELDATIEFLEGEKVTDANAHYLVKDPEGNLLCEVGYTGEGGQNNRVILDGIQGTYTGAEGDLVLDGSGNATLAGESYSYTILAPGTIQLVQGGTMITVELGESTYVVTERTEAENDYIGYTYAGTFERDGDSYRLEISFVDALHARMRILYGTTEMVPNSSWQEGFVEAQSYAIGEDGVVTLQTYDNDGNPVTLTLTPGADSSTLTVVEDVSWIYPTAGTVLTRQ